MGSHNNSTPSSQTFFTPCNRNTFLLCIIFFSWIVLIYVPSEIAQLASNRYLILILFISSACSHPSEYSVDEYHTLWRYSISIFFFSPTAKPPHLKCPLLDPKSFYEIALPTSPDFLFNKLPFSIFTISLYTITCQSLSVSQFSQINS